MPIGLDCLTVWLIQSTCIHVAWLTTSSSFFGVLLQTPINQSISHSKRVRNPDKANPSAKSSESGQAPSHNVCCIMHLGKSKEDRIKF